MSISACVNCLFAIEQEKKDIWSVREKLSIVPLPWRWQGFPLPELSVAFHRRGVRRKARGSVLGATLWVNRGLSPRGAG